MNGLTVRELINALLDFPLDSRVCIENNEEYYPLLNISHDSEYGDFGECYYDCTSLCFTNGDIGDFKQDFRGDFVNKQVFEAYDEDEREFIKLRFDEDSYNFKECDKWGVFKE